MSNLGEKISITFFVSPYDFFYKKCSNHSKTIANNKNENPMNEFESKINDLINKNKLKSSKEVHPGYCVAWKYSGTNRWIRVEVIKIFQFEQNMCYKLWAMDYGVPLYVKNCTFYLLPYELTKPSNLIFWGGISNVHPIVNEYDFLKQQNIEIRVKDWSEKTNETLKKNLENSNLNIVFNEMYQKNDHHWGKLTIINEHKTYDVSASLLDMKVAALDAVVDNDVINRNIKLLKTYIGDLKINPKYEEIIKTQMEDQKLKLINDDDKKKNRRDSFEKTSTNLASKSKLISDDDKKKNRRDSFGKTSKNLASQSFTNSNHKVQNLSEDAFLVLNKHIPFEQISLYTKKSSNLSSKSPSLSSKSPSLSSKSPSLSSITSSLSSKSKRKSPTTQNKSQAFKGSVQQKECRNNSKVNNNKTQYESKTETNEKTKKDNQIKALRELYFSITSNSDDAMRGYPKKFYPAGFESKEYIKYNEEHYAYNPEFLNCRKDFSYERLAHQKANTLKTKDFKENSLSNSKNSVASNTRSSSLDWKTLRNLTSSNNSNGSSDHLKNSLDLYISNILENVNDPEDNSKEDEHFAKTFKNFPLDNKLDEFFFNKLKEFNLIKDTHNNLNQGRSLKTNLQFYKVLQSCEINDNSNNDEMKNLKASRNQNDSGKYRTEQRESSEDMKTKGTSAQIKLKGDNHLNLNIVADKQNEPNKVANVAVKYSKKIPIQEIEEKVNESIAQHNKIPDQDENKLTKENSFKKTSERIVSNNRIEFLENNSRQEQNIKKHAEHKNSSKNINNNDGKNLNEKILEDCLEISKMDDSNKIIQVQKLHKIEEIKGEVKFARSAIDHWVLYNTKVPIFELKSKDDPIFHKEISKAMREIYIDNIYRTQAYAWPHLLKNNSLFLISPKSSGKTWCYLPAICSIVAYHLYSNINNSNNNNYKDKTYGPMAIITVPTSTDAEKLTILSQRLMSVWEDQDIKPIVTCCSKRNDIDVRLQLLNSCGILITTPSSLIRILNYDKNQSLIDPKRLKHIVFDDIDAMLFDSKINFCNAFKLMKLIAGNKNIQLVMTSTIWSEVFRDLFFSSSDPLFLIGDFLQGCISSGRLQFFSIYSPKKEISKMLEFMKKVIDAKKQKTVIFCNNDDEIDHLKDSLNAVGYECIIYTNRENLKYQNYCNVLTTDKILICTDDNLPHLKIQDATFIIHYSLPVSWTKFTSRFFVASEHYKNVFQKDSTQMQQEGHQCHHVNILLYFTHNNLRHYSKCVQYMLLYKKDFKGIDLKLCWMIEKMKIADGTNICFKYFHKWEFCKNRHKLSVKDCLDKNDPLLSSGTFHISILQVMSPTDFVARILEYKPLDGEEWLPVKESNKFTSFSLSMNLYYSNAINQSYHWPLTIGDICIYEYRESFRRARIETINTSSTNMNIYDDKAYVSIYLIDHGRTIENVKVTDLLKINEQFLNYPSQAINIRVLGIVPEDNESTWTSESKQFVQNWLQTTCTGKHYITISNKYAIKDNILVDTIYIQRDLPTIKVRINEYCLKAVLIEKEFGVSKPLETHPIIKEIERIYKEYQQNEDQPPSESKAKDTDKGDNEDKEQAFNSEPKAATNEQSKNSKEFEKISQDDNDIEKDHDNEATKVPICEGNTKDDSKSLDVFLSKELENCPAICLNGKQSKPSLTTNDLLDNETRNKSADSNPRRETETETPKHDESNETKEQLQSLSAPLTNANDQIAVLPSLVSRFQIPLTTWYENDFIIFILIHVPDCEKYYLNINEETICFSTIINDEKYALVLNLLGSIDTTKVFHEIRGLNVSIRLAKTVYMSWPRLIKQTDKFTWLKFKFDALTCNDDSDDDDNDFTNLCRLQKFDQNLHSNYSSSSESDTEMENLQTFHPIANDENLLDPISDVF